MRKILITFFSLFLIVGAIAQNQTIRRGGGSSGSSGIWTNDNGVVKLINENGNVLSFISASSDNATNVAMVVNSASPWSGGNLLSFRNNGAEKASINYVGGVTKGTKTETIWGALPTEGEFFIGMNDVSNGDGINYAIAHGAFQTNDWSGAYSYFEIGGDTNEFLLSGITQGESKYYEVHLGAEPDITGGLRLTLSDIGGNLMRLSPAVASESTPYLFDTESTRTSRLLDVANNGTNKFSIMDNGAIQTGSNTNQWYFKTATTSNLTFNVNGTDYPVYHTGKQRKSLKFNFPRMIDGSGATYANTNNYLTNTFMVPQFSGTAASNANYIRFGVRVPFDVDTTVDLSAALTVELTGADTGAQVYHVGMVSIASSASINGTAANYNIINIAADASGADNDVESSTNTTLTGWRSNITAGQWWLIELRRNGADDASTVASRFRELEIFYSATQ